METSSKLTWVDILGMLWACPITLIVFTVYVLPFWLLGWYKSEGWHVKAWVWSRNPGKGPKALRDYWDRWGGHAMGNIVVVRQMATDVNDLRWRKLMVHEQHHVVQCMRLGPFQPLMYLTCLLIGACVKHVEAYHDNIFEIAARREADTWLAKILADRETN